MTQRLVGAACLLASMALHVGLMRSGPAAAPPARPQARSLVRVSVASNPRPPAPPEPERPPEAPQPRPKPKPTAPLLEPQPATTPTDTPSDGSEPAPAELTGNTVLGTSAAAWVALPGSGAERDGAIGAGLARTVAPRASASGAAAAASAPATVPLAQLSRKPLPPPLAGALERNYPAAARKQGQSGDAKVRARIEPTGDVRQVSITSESSHGFGEACRRTLLASKWTAPLSDAGRPVATWISYRCKFRIEN